MLSILTSVLLLFPALPQEPAPSCPSQQAEACQEAAKAACDSKVADCDSKVADCDSKASCDTLVATKVVAAQTSECDSKVAACDSKATACETQVAACDSKPMSMDYALASITLKLDAQEPECSSKAKSECSTKTDCETKSECSTDVVCDSKASYTVVMNQIDACLEQTGCDSKKSECSSNTLVVSNAKAECSTEAACDSKADCDTKSDCETQADCQEPCTSEAKPAARVVRLVAPQQGACSEVKAQDCKPSDCDTKADCNEAQFEVSTAVTLVNDAQADCSEGKEVRYEVEVVCEESASACNDVTAASACNDVTAASACSDEKAASGCCDEKAASACCDEKAASACSDKASECVEIVACEETTECSEEIALNWVQAANAECNELVMTELDGKQIAMVVRVEGDVDNLDGQIQQLIQQIDMKEHGKGMAMIRVAGAEGKTHKGIRLNAPSEGVHMIRLADLNVECGEIADCSDKADCGDKSDCGDKAACDDDRGAKKVVKKRIEMRRPAAAPQVRATVKPMISKRIRLTDGAHDYAFEAHGAHGEHGAHGHDGHGHGEHASHNMEHRLAELEARLARIESMLERLERRL